MSEKQWKVLRICLENQPTVGPSGNQIFRRGCAPQESLIPPGYSGAYIRGAAPANLANPVPRLFWQLFPVPSPISL